MDCRALQQQSQIAFTAQQRLQPLQKALGRFFAGLAVFYPLRGALHQPEQAGAGFIAQAADAGVAAPVGHLAGQHGRQNFDQVFNILRRGRAACSGLGGAAFVVVALLLIAAEQGVELLRHQFAVLVKLVQKGAAVGKTHGAGNPQQIVVACGQHMGLLVVQVLNAMLNLAQEGIGAAQGVGNLGTHQIGAHQTLQRLQRRAAAQLGELAAAHHLQQLHDEFDLANAAA